MRSTLNAREDRAIDVFGQRLLAQDQCATWAAQTLMRSRGHDIGEWHGAGVDAGSDQSSDMRDVGHEARADAVGDLTEALPVDETRIRRCAGDDEPRLVLAGQRRDAIVVDDLRGRVHAVVDEAVELAREAHRAAMGQVPALRQLHAQDRVAGLEEREVHGHVGRAA